MANTYLALYGSGFLSPEYAGQTYDLGNAFKLNADARYNKYVTATGDIKKYTIHQRMKI